MQIKRLFYKIVFFAGWMLSPFTAWNDAFVNIPIAYLLANRCMPFFPLNFSILVLVFYWLSNGLGILMMYAAGRREVLAENTIGKGLVKFLATIVIYSLILLILGKTGILRPL